MMVLPLAVSVGAIAATVNLQWNHDVPTPERYRIDKPEQGQSFDYGRPEWSGSEAAGVVNGLKAGNTSYFVLGAYTADEKTGAPNEAVYTVGAPASPPTATPPYLTTDSDRYGTIDSYNHQATTNDPGVMILTLAIGNGRRLMGINIEERPNTLSPAGAEAIAPQLLKIMATEEYQYAYGLLDFKNCLWSIRSLAECDRLFHYAGYTGKIFGLRCTQFFQ
jgi:hypothetical protein